MAEQNTDPEAWLADQLAQLEIEHDPFGSPSLCWSPGEPAFAAVEKLAQEYGEMCVARARGHDVLIPGCPVEVQVSDERLGGVAAFTGTVTNERNHRHQLIVKVR